MKFIGIRRVSGAQLSPRIKDRIHQSQSLTCMLLSRDNEVGFKLKFTNFAAEIFQMQALIPMGLASYTSPCNVCFAQQAEHFKT